MGIEVPGSIGRDNLLRFAVASTFRRYKEPWANTKRARCKVCAEVLPAGAGRAISIVGASQRQRGNVYLCSGCYVDIVQHCQADGRCSPLPPEMGKKGPPRLLDPQDPVDALTLLDQDPVVAKVPLVEDDAALLLELALTEPADYN